MERRVKESYEKINISDSARKRIIYEIENDENELSNKKSVFLLYKAKIAIIACFLLVLIMPIGVYAAGKIYHFVMTVVKNGDYNVNMEMEKIEDNNDRDTENDIPSHYIKIVPNLGTEYEVNKKDDCVYCCEFVDGYDCGQSFWYQLCYMEFDMKETISTYDVADCEMFTVNGRTAVYSNYNDILNSEYENNKTSYGQSLYIFMEDYGYVLVIGAQKGLSKEDLIQLVNKFEIEEVDSIKDSSEYVMFSERECSGWEEAANYSDEKNEIVNYFETQAIIGNTTYQVVDVQILDSIDTLQKEAFILNHFDMNSLVTEDGKLKKYDRELLELGDGISEPKQKVIKTEKIQPKLVYVTLDVTNSIEKSFDGKFYIPSLKFVTKKDGQVFERLYKDVYKRPEYVNDACVDLAPCYLENNLGGKSSWAVNASKGTIRIRFAYLVDEDFIDGMTLWLNDYYQSTSDPYCLDILK